MSNTIFNPGDRFGAYQAVRRLGKGGMGEVWLMVSDSGLENAAKILNPDDAADHDARKRFVREAELAMGVKDDNLVEVYDVGEDPDTGLCYIMMEYVPGGTLADYLKAKGALPIEDAVAVVYAIEALQAPAAFTEDEIAKMRKLKPEKAVQKTFDRLFPGWKVSGVGGSVEANVWNNVGYSERYSGRKNVCFIVPSGKGKPAKLVRQLKLPKEAKSLDFSLSCSCVRGDGK